MSIESKAGTAGGLAVGHRASVLGAELRYPNRRKLDFLLPALSPGDRVLDLGCGGMWLTRELRARGFDCVGVDLQPPADIVASVHEARFADAAFDAVIALEMLEHEDCTAEIARILRPGGTLVVSTPVPRWDWLLWIGERAGLCQPRQTPHSNLFALEDLPFVLERRETILGLVQLGVYRNS
jgi:2-polyprenyl-3-methyl-5-hydroxy-6-metoxy-1,4-benzoquinol methylase